jgi:hypothetical protein
MLLSKLVKNPLMGFYFEGDAGSGGGSAAPVPAGDGGVPPGDSSGGGQPPAETPPVPDATPVVEPVVPAEVHVPPLPGQQQTQFPKFGPDEELNSLRSVVQRSQQEIARLQSDLKEYEYAGMEEGEKELAQLREQQASAEQQRRQQEDLYWTQQLWQYYNGWNVPVAEIQGQTPLEWQHAVLTFQHKAITQKEQELANLKKELSALKTAAETPSVKPEPTSNRSGGPASRPTLWGMSLKDLEKFQQRALAGEVTVDDYPAVPEVK